jgi:hypothetical protein
MMTRWMLKAGLVAASLAATLGGWALLARADEHEQQTPPPAQVVVSMPTLQPIPTLVRPLTVLAPNDVTAQASISVDLPPIPELVAPPPAPRPEPVARTRSSR